MLFVDALHVDLVLLDLHTSLADDIASARVALAKQVLHGDHFSLDLHGHGEVGLDSLEYIMEAFGRTLHHISDVGCVGAHHGVGSRVGPGGGYNETVVLQLDVDLSMEQFPAHLALGSLDRYLPSFNAYLDAFRDRNFSGDHGQDLLSTRTLEAYHQLSTFELSRDLRPLSRS